MSSVQTLVACWRCSIPNFLRGVRRACVWASSPTPAPSVGPVVFSHTMTPRSWIREIFILRLFLVSGWCNHLFRSVSSYPKLTWPEVGTGWFISGLIKPVSSLAFSGTRSVTDLYLSPQPDSNTPLDYIPGPTFRLHHWLRGQGLMQLQFSKLNLWRLNLAGCLIWTLSRLKLSRLYHQPLWLALYDKFGICKISARWRHGLLAQPNIVWHCVFFAVMHFSSKNLFFLTESIPKSQSWLPAIVRSLAEPTMSSNKPDYSRHQ